MKILGWSRIEDTRLEQDWRYSVGAGLEILGWSRIEDTWLEQDWRYSVGAGLEILCWSWDGSGLEILGLMITKGGAVNI